MLARAVARRCAADLAQIGRAARQRQIAAVDDAGARTRADNSAAHRGECAVDRAEYSEVAGAENGRTGRKDICRPGLTNNIADIDGSRIAIADLQRTDG